MKKSWKLIIVSLIWILMFVVFSNIVIEMEESKYYWSTPHTIVNGRYVSEVDNIFEFINYAFESNEINILIQGFSSILNLFLFPIILLTFVISFIKSLKMIKNKEKKSISKWIIVSYLLMIITFFVNWVT